MPAPHTDNLTRPRILDQLWHAARHHVEQYANNRVESDHAQLKRWLRPMRGIKTMTGLRILAAGQGFVQEPGGQRRPSATIGLVPDSYHEGAADLGAALDQLGSGSVSTAPSIRVTCWEMYSASMQVAISWAELTPVPAPVSVRAGRINGRPDIWVYGFSAQPSGATKRLRSATILAALHLAARPDGPSALGGPGIQHLIGSARNPET
jgi:DDE domain